MNSKQMKIEYRTGFLQSDDETQGQIVEGYAAVFDQPATIYESEYSGWKYIEKIDRNAFANAKMNDVVFKYNHDDNALILARTSNNTLNLSVDNTGLKIRADIIDTNAGQDVYKLIKRKDLTKMSFAFTVKDDTVKTDSDNKIYTRTINSFKEIFDVAVVDFPAYEGTSIEARNQAYFEQLENQIREKERRKRLFLLASLSYSYRTENV